VCIHKLPKTVRKLQGKLEAMEDEKVATRFEQDSKLWQMRDIARKQQEKLQATEVMKIETQLKHDKELRQMQLKHDKELRQMQLKHDKELRQMQDTAKEQQEKLTVMEFVMSETQFKLVYELHKLRKEHNQELLERESKSQEESKVKEELYQELQKKLEAKETIIQELLEGKRKLPKQVDTEETAHEGRLEMESRERILQEEIGVSKAHTQQLQEDLAVKNNMQCLEVRLGEDFELNPRRIVMGVATVRPFPETMHAMQLNETNAFSLLENTFNDHVTMENSGMPTGDALAGNYYSSIFEDFENAAVVSDGLAGLIVHIVRFIRKNFIAVAANDPCALSCPEHLLGLIVYSHDIQASIPDIMALVERR
jgi:hypothetical protein